MYAHPTLPALQHGIFGRALHTQTHLTDFVGVHRLLMPFPGTVDLAILQLNGLEGGVFGVVTERTQQVLEGGRAGLLGLDPG